jgi:Alpha-L-arabinofuranosidase B, catalytic
MMGRAIHLIVWLLLWAGVSLSALALPGNNHGTPPWFNGPSNPFGGLTGVWATRKVISTYAGPAMQVQRASDNALSTINFIGNDLDTASLLTFCAATTCGPRIWYDQGGSLGRNMTTVVIGPKIVTAGALSKTVNGKACIYNNPSGSVGMQAGGGNYISTSAYTMLVVGRAITGGANDMTTSARWQIAGDFLPSNGTWSIGFASSVAPGAPVMGAVRIDNTSTARVASVSYTFDTDGIFSSRFKTTDATPFKGYLDGATPGTNANANPMLTANSEASVGVNLSFFDGYYCEFEVFNIETSLADSNTIGHAQAAYWNLTWTNITQ